MKTKPLTFLLALTFLISGSTIVSAKQKFGDYEGAIYVRNYDGDTITFNLPNLHPIIGKKSCLIKILKSKRIKVLARRAH